MSSGTGVARASRPKYFSRGQRRLRAGPRGRRLKSTGRAGCRGGDPDAVPGGETVLGPRIIVDIGEQGKITSFVIVPPHRGLGMRHRGGIKCAQVGMARKDGIAGANKNRSPAIIATARSRALRVRSPTLMRSSQDITFVTASRKARRCHTRRVVRAAPSIVRARFGTRGSCAGASGENRGPKTTDRMSDRSALARRWSFRPVPRVGK